MKNTLSNLVIFAAGAAIGSLVTWRILKPYYENIVQEEIESVKEVFSTRAAESTDEDMEDASGPNPEPIDIREYAATIQDNRYTNYSDKKEVQDNVRKPYVVTPEEFGEREGYEVTTLIYYAGDGVLTDDMNHPIEDVENTVGQDFHTHYGEYEDDSVFVRNEESGTDYEILLDPRSYSDVVNRNPHLAED